jgi:hypothetical protein
MGTIAVAATLVLVDSQPLVVREREREAADSQPRPVPSPPPAAMIDDASEVPIQVDPAGREDVTSAEAASVAVIPPLEQGVVVPATEVPPFDAARFAADPEAYLAAVVPERVFQTAEPASDVPQLAAEVAIRQDVALGDGINLRVRTLPLAPVTFCAADGGTFANGRSTVSVRADPQGLASARYAPSQGTYHRARVVAASPMTSGRVGFTLTVIRPETGDLARE